MRVLITTDSGEVLDSEDISREEFDNLSAMGALLLIRGLQIGDAQ